MSIAGDLPLEADFPNPEEQADVLMEICEGNVEEAGTIATRNVKFARNECDRDYWSLVKLLISKYGGQRKVATDRFSKKH